MWLEMITLTHSLADCGSEKPAADPQSWRSSLRRCLRRPTRPRGRRVGPPLVQCSRCRRCVCANQRNGKTTAPRPSSQGNVRAARRTQEATARAQPASISARRTMAQHDAPLPAPIAFNQLAAPATPTTLSSRARPSDPPRPIRLDSSSQRAAAREQQ